MESRALIRVPVPPGTEGPHRLLPALAGALTGEAPAIAPVPTVSATTSAHYVTSVLAAVRPEGPELESDEVALVVPTSGSTGEPRGVLLTASALTHASAFVNSPDAQWVLALPVTSIGGINVLVRALASGRDPIVLPSIGGAAPFTPVAFAKAVRAASDRGGSVHVSLVPAQVARLLGDAEGTEALTACHRILVGGAALRPSLRDLAEREGISLTTTYGATETAGGCVLDGRPLPGVTVTEEAGTLVLGGPTIALGYRGEPELSARTFGPDGFRTNDVGVIAPDGSVTVIGRADDVVIIKGINVSVTAVEQVLADHPDVESAAVTTAPGPDGEPRLHGFIVVRDHARHASRDAADAVVARLGSAARVHVHEVASLPHLPHGKVDRQRLAAWARDEREDP